MYKWPQGKVIRTICALLALVIAVDLGYSGAWGQLGAIVEQGSLQAATWRQLVVGGIYAAASLTMLIGGFIAVGFHKKAVDFLIEVEQEMTRVTWPSGRELVRATIFIAIMIVVLAGGIVAVDIVNRSLLKLIFGVES
jgi:preprotein translocase SecE subunit